MSWISNILDKYGKSASLAQADDFAQWLVNVAWNKYTEDKMNKRIVIENKIKSECNPRVPNGTVKKDYFAQIELPVALVKEAWIAGLDNLGLKCEKGESASADKIVLTITGKPAEAGDSTVELRFRHKDWIDGEPISSVNIPIAFNPDPRSLWKNLPTDKETTIFYKDDFECDYVKVEANSVGEPRKDIVVASQRGRSHGQEAKPRDDHYSVYHCKDSEWYILAVADGAGSAKFSRKGSAIACSTVMEHCKSKLLSCNEFEANITNYYNANDKTVAQKAVTDNVYGILGTAAYKAYKAINDFAVEISAKDGFSGTKAKDFATTLMFSICKKFDFGWFVASYWVGDGAMCLYNKEKGTHKLLGIPDEGEFSGQTRFLTMPEIFKDGEAVMSRLRFSIEEDFTALFLMTDGVSDPMFETDNNLNSIEKWNEFWNKLHDGFADDEIPGVELVDDNEESKYQLLRWLDFWSPGNHDDRTIAILY